MIQDHCEIYNLTSILEWHKDDSEDLYCHIIVLHRKGGKQEAHDWVVIVS